MTIHYEASRDDIFWILLLLPLFCGLWNGGPYLMTLFSNVNLYSALRLRDQVLHP